MKKSNEKFVKSNEKLAIDINVTNYKFRLTSLQIVLF